MAKFKGFIKHCEVCGTEFKVPKSHAHIRTCSKECGLKIRKVVNKVDPVKWECKHCQKPMFDPPSLAAQRVYCSKTCMFESESLTELKSKAFAGDKNPAWKGGVTTLHTSKTGRVYKRIPLHREIEKGVRRKRAIEGATPAWSDRNKVLEIYEQARKVSELTGIQHHVDHVVPLTSKKVCGLHNEFNLRVIPAIDNLKKHNRTWPSMW